MSWIGRNSSVSHSAGNTGTPNSGLGEAFSYMLDRWDKFTLFLRLPGAPLHNTVIERALMLHEKAVIDDPAAWLPWAYRDTLAALLRDTPRSQDKLPPSPA